jgi:peroxiredoxin
MRKKLSGITCIETQETRSRTMKNFNRFISKCFLLAIIILAWITPAQAEHNAFELLGVSKPRTVKMAPDFSLTDINGKKVSLKDYRGKSVLINFWATWCGPCREELPSLQSLHEKLSGEGFVVLAINIDRRNPDRVKKYMKEYNLSFSVPIDPSQEVRKKYYIMGLPVSYLVDPNGKLRGFISGARSWDSPASIEVMRSLNNYLAGNTPNNLIKKTKLVSK